MADEALLHELVPASAEGGLEALQRRALCVEAKAASLSGLLRLERVEAVRRSKLVLRRLTVLMLQEVGMRPELPHGQTSAPVSQPRRSGMGPCTTRHPVTGSAQAALSTREAGEVWRS